MRGVHEWSLDKGRSHLFCQSYYFINILVCHEKVPASIPGNMCMTFIYLSRELGCNLAPVI